MHGCTKFNHRPNKEQYRIVRYNMTGRLMYIPKEIASNFGHAETLGEGDLNTVKGRISDFSTVSILKILSQLLRAGPKSSAKSFCMSTLKFDAISFGMYINRPVILYRTIRYCSLLGL